MAAVFYEPFFGLDAFEKPLVYEDWEAIAKAIIIVLFGREGFYPSIPQLGMGIQKYRYLKMDDIDTDLIKSELAFQLNFLSGSISTDELQVLKTVVAKDVPALIFVIPVYVDRPKNSIAISVIEREDAISYNYDLIEAAKLTNF